MRCPAFRAAVAASILTCAASTRLSAQSVLVEAKTTAGDEVATIRTDSMRLRVPLHLLVGGLLFPDGTLQTTAADGTTSVTSAQIVDGTIVDADISDTAAIADTKLGTIMSAGRVANSATTATPSNTASAIVARDAAGGFEAGYVAVADSLRVGGEGSFLAAGTYTSMTTVLPPASGAGTRMMWYPERAAFRAGNVTGTQWDASNIGLHSIALNSNTTASGYASTALGLGTTASGYASTALGLGTTASEMQSTAFGESTTASGFSSTAMGGRTIASGAYSTALGGVTTASGNYSTALGGGTNAQAYASTAIGRYNVVHGNATSWITTDALFVAGNGTGDASRSNALTLYKNGNLTIAGTLTQSSDARLKEGIEPLEGTLDRVLQLTPIRYHFRANTGRPEGMQIGLTAQQMAPLFPELVTRDGDGYLSLSYANLSAVLVKAVQEQESEIAALKDEMAALRAARESAETRVARLESLVRQLLSASAAPSAAPTLPDARR